MFKDIIEHLKAGGIFSGQLFGVNDEWNTPERNITFHTLDRVKKLLDELRVVELEEDEDSVTADGTPKHWHVFHIIAQKP